MTSTYIRPSIYHQSFTKFVSQAYHKIQYKSKTYDDMWGLIKVAILLIAIIICWLTYIIFVNKASTYGYFYRVESRKLDTVIFQQNLVKLDVMAGQQKLRENTSFYSLANPITFNVADRIVHVTVNKQVAFNR